MRGRRATAFHFALIAALGVLVYSNTPGAPFFWDDKGLVANNPLVRDLGYFLNPESGKSLELHGAVMRRYVGYLTFALDYRAHGLDVWGYHAVNLAIHIVNAMLLYALVLLTVRTPALSGSPIAARSRGAALLAASLFVAHPVQTEAVTYVFQRHASLAALFCLLAITSYAGSRLAHGRARGLALYALSVLSMALAMKSKENAFTFPLVMVLYEAVFFRADRKSEILNLKSHISDQKFQISNLKFQISRGAALLPLLLTMLVVPLSLLSSGGPAGEAVAGVDAPPEGYATSGRWQYLITQPRVAATYLRLLLLPMNQNIDYDYPAFGSLLTPALLFSLALIAALLLLAVRLMRLSRRGEPGLSLVGFGLLWFFVALSVESSVIPIPMLINEYRLYLPSAGFFMAAAAGGALVQGRLTGWMAKAARGAAVAAVLLMALAAFARNALWSSEAELWEDTVRKSPGKMRAHYNLAVLYHEGGRFREAAERYEEALRIMPDVVEAHENLSAAYLSLGLKDKAIEHCREAVSLAPESASTHNNCGLTYAAIGMAREAEAHYLRAIGLKPGYAEARNNLGALYGTMGDYGRAIEQLEEAVRLMPSSASAHSNLGLAYLKTGLIEKAAEQMKRAEELSR